MIEYLLLTVAFVIVGIQGYLFAKIQMLKRDKKTEVAMENTILFHDKVMVDLNRRVQELEKRVGVQAAPTNIPEIPTAPNDKQDADWMKKYQ